MTRLLLMGMVFLAPALALAGEGDLFVVERSDGSGSSISVLRQHGGSGNPTFVKLGAMALVPNAIFAATPFSAIALDTAHLFQSVVTPITQDARSHRLATGALPQLSHHYPNVALTALAPFAFNEAIAWDSARNALVILRPDGLEYASADNFLNPGPLQDISIARISDVELLMMYSTASNAPPQGFTSDYTISRIDLRAAGKASHICSKHHLRKVAGTRPLLSNAGAFYVSADAYGQFLVHQTILAEPDQSAHLRRFSVPFGTSLTPIGHGSAGHSRFLEVQIGDDLWELDFGSHRGSVAKAGMFSSLIGSATVTRSSKGPARHRLLDVTQSWPKWFFSYRHTTFFRSGAPAAASPSPKPDIAARFDATWNAARGQYPFIEVSTTELAMLLNLHPGPTAWLYDLLMALTEDQRTALGIHKRIHFHAVDTHGKLKLETLYDVLAALPNCGVILATNPASP